VAMWMALFREFIWQKTCALVIARLFTYQYNHSKPINEDVKWTGEQWEFALERPCGGYADKYDRLKHYVHMLKNRISYPRIGRQR
jgi:hypothetical protein